MKFNIIRQSLAIAALATASISTSFADTASVSKTLQKNYPNMPAKVIDKTPITGLYEVMIDGELMYTDETARYFFIGNLVDYKNQKNLTESRMQEITKIDVKSLPLNQALKYVKGNGSRVIYLFTDPDCPYCKRMEQELEKVNNITVYLFPFPIKSLHPNAETVAKQIWCSKDAKSAWKDYVLKDKNPSSTATSCANPIDANVQLGDKLNINGTPTFFLANGARISGAVTAEQLESLLKDVK